MIRKTYMILELKQNVRFKNCTLDIDTDEKKTSCRLLDLFPENHRATARETTMEFSSKELLRYQI